MKEAHAWESKNLKLGKWFKDVPPEQVERLLGFRAAYPYKHATINGVAWQYIAVGEGARATLLLSGALGVAHFSWRTISDFINKYRVIAPSYPPVDSMAELVDGIAQIMEQEGIAKAAVVGGSYGGLVAQVFVRRHPDKSTKLVISHSFAPDPEGGKKLKGAVRWLPLLPIGPLRTLLRKRLGVLLPEGHAESALLKAEFNEVIDRHLTRESIISAYRRAMDFTTNYVFTPQDLAEWPGEVLLIMADDDPATPEPVREEMKRLYPKAQVHLFSGTGHATAVLRQDEYLATIEAFID